MSPNWTLLSPQACMALARQILLSGTKKSARTTTLGTEPTPASGTRTTSATLPWNVLSDASSLTRNTAMNAVGGNADLADITYVTQFGDDANIPLIVEMVAYQFDSTENLLVDFRLNAGRYQMSFQPGTGAEGYTVVVFFPATMVHPSKEAFELAAEIVTALHNYRGIDGEAHIDLNAAGAVVSRA